MKTRNAVLLAAALWAMSSLTFLAQRGGFAGALPLNATVTAIDKNSYTMTLRTEKGEEDVFAVSPAVRGFTALKAGDKLKATYFESLVYAILRPGDTANPSYIDAALTRAKNVRPSGSVVTQDKATVTVKSVDAGASSITVTGADGKTITRKVQDKASMDGLKAGERIEISYTKALLASAERQDEEKK